MRTSAHSLPVRSFASVDAVRATTETRVMTARGRTRAPTSTANAAWLGSGSPARQGCTVRGGVVVVCPPLIGCWAQRVRLWCAEVTELAHHEAVAEESTRLHHELPPRRRKVGGAHGVAHPGDARQRGGPRPRLCGVLGVLCSRWAGLVGCERGVLSVWDSMMARWRLS